MNVFVFHSQIQIKLGQVNFFLVIFKLKKKKFKKIGILKHPVFPGGHPSKY
jgi:hypothetical protein